MKEFEVDNMVNFGEGSDWNFEMDGYPECICDIEEEHSHTPEELWERNQYYKEIYEHNIETNAETFAPATGEFPVVGICGTLTLFLIGILMFAKKRFKKGLSL